MKKLIHDINRDPIIFDTEKDTIDIIKSPWFSQKSTYEVPEDCEGILLSTDNSGNKIKKVVNLKKGQIIITYWNEDLPNRFVIVDNKEISENLKVLKEISKNKIKQYSDCESTTK